MSKLPRFVNMAVPDSDGVMHTGDWMRADIANGVLEALESLERTAGIASASDDPVRVAARAIIAKAKGE